MLTYILLNTMRVLTYVVILSAVLPNLTPLFSEDGWSRLHSEEAVEVSMRKSNSSRYGEFRSVTQVNQEFTQTYDIFRDFSTYSDWFGFCIESYQVTEHSSFHKTAFIGINAPWPVRDKYMILEVYFDFNKERKKGTIVFTLARKNYGINPDSYDPMIAVEGECVLEEVARKRTRVTFTFINDPGGNVPKVFLKKFLQEQMAETARGLRRFAVLRK